MKQASSTEIQNALKKTVQACHDIIYPITKRQLLDKSKSLNTRSKVIQSIETILVICPVQTKSTDFSTYRNLKPFRTLYRLSGLSHSLHQKSNLL